MTRHYFISYMWWNTKTNQVAGFGSCNYETNGGSPIKNKNFFEELDDVIRNSTAVPTDDKKIIYTSVNELQP